MEPDPWSELQQPIRRQRSSTYPYSWSHCAAAPSEVPRVKEALERSMRDMSVNQR